MTDIIPMGTVRAFDEGLKTDVDVAVTYESGNQIGIGPYTIHVNEAPYVIDLLSDAITTLQEGLHGSDHLICGWVEARDELTSYDGDNECSVDIGVYNTHIIAFDYRFDLAGAIQLREVLWQTTKYADSTILGDAIYE